MRVEIDEVVFNATNPVTYASGATVYVYDRDTEDEVTVYAAGSGGTTLAQPLTTDVAGRIEGWVGEGEYDLFCTKAGRSWTQPFTTPRTGPIGIPGAPGYTGTVGLMPGVDVWTLGGDTPEDVTDWGAIINAAIADGARLLFFRAEDFPITTMIDAEGVGVADDTGLTFQGQAGWNWAFLGSSPSRLIWKGTGSGRAFDFRSCMNPVFRDLGIHYDDDGYTGDFMDFGYGGTGAGLGVVGGAGIIMERVTVSALDSADAATIFPETNLNARCLLRLDKVVTAKFADVTLAGAQSLVRGPEATGAYASNQIVFRDCQFVSFEDAAVMNPGLDWEFDHCCWEFTFSGATARGIGADVDRDSGNPSVFTVNNKSTFWDFAEEGQKSIVQPLDSYWDMTVDDANFHGAHDEHDVDMRGGGTFSVENCEFQASVNGPPINAGDVSDDVGARKDRVTIRNIGLGATSVSGDDAVVSNLAGHKQVNIDLIGRGGNSTFDPQIRTIGGYERLIGKGHGKQPDYTNFAIHGGYSAPSPFIIDFDGTDMAGVLRLSTAAGAAPAGVALDFTFEVPMLAAYRTATRHTYPLVELFPLAIDTASPDADALIAAGPYPVLPNSGTDPMTATTGFSIAFANELASGNAVALGFRVLQL